MRKTEGRDLRSGSEGEAGVVHAERCCVGGTGESPCP